MTRILRIKYLLGLFDNPYVEVERAVRESNTKESRELVLQTAREGIVLLKNEKNLLPLDKNINSIAVIGPNADAARNQLGDYTSNPVLQDVITVLEGVRNKVSPKTKINYVKGCEIIGDELNEINKAREAAKKSDIAIVVVGENGERTNGEGNDVRLVITGPDGKSLYDKIIDKKLAGRRVYGAQEVDGEWIKKFTKEAGTYTAALYLGNKLESSCEFNVADEGADRKGAQRDGIAEKTKETPKERYLKIKDQKLRYENLPEKGDEMIAINGERAIYCRTIEGKEDYFMVKNSSEYFEWRDAQNGKKAK